MKQRNWDDVSVALLDGKVIRIEGVKASVITGRLSGRSAIGGRQTVRTRRQTDGVVVWLEQKENR